VPAWELLTGDLLTHLLLLLPPLLLGAVCFHPLQHRGQDSAGMVTTDWSKFREYKDNGLVKDVFAKKSVMDKLTGERKILYL
jgi:glutamine phosphoribosylpyrophosphate amidotransferase